MKDFMTVILGLVLVVAFFYGMYWLTKHGSYFFFYESMVQETIREMVKPEHLLQEP